MVGPPERGTRTVAQRAGLPYTTVRDWRRRFISRAEVLSTGARRAVVALGGVVPQAGRDAGGGRHRGAAGGLAGSTPACPRRRRQPMALRQRARRRSPPLHQHKSALVNELKAVFDASWACRRAARCATGRHQMAGDQQRDPEEARALFRYSVIAEAINPRLSPAERGRIARELAGRAWVSPEGTERSYQPHQHRPLARRLCQRRLGRPAPAAPHRQGQPPAPGRVAGRGGQAATGGAGPLGGPDRRHHRPGARGLPFRAHRARAPAPGSACPARRWRPPRPVRYGRFEAARPNEIWIGDVLHGPFVPWPRVPGSKRAKLFLLVDDYSRLLVHGRWVSEENTRAGQDVLRSAITRRGLPEVLYVDNGAPYS